MSEFKNKKILITGGTKGLGLATAKVFAQLGADLILAYKADDESAEKASHAIQQLGRQCQLIKSDLSEENAIDKVFDEIDRLDIYIHNAAATAFKDLMQIEKHHIHKTMNISLTSFIRGVQRAAQTMPRGSAIISISGMDTRQVVKYHGLLAAAKAALEQLTLYWAHELAAKGIQVNCVNPGFLETESTKKMLGPQFETISKKHASTLPLKRPAQLEEIANVIKFLASSEASWLVGQTIYADGGFSESIGFL